MKKLSCAVPKWDFAEGSFCGAHCKLCCRGSPRKLASQMAIKMNHLCGSSKLFVFWNRVLGEKQEPRNLQANLFGPNKSFFYCAPHSNQLDTKTKPGKNRNLASAVHSGPLAKRSASLTFPILLCEVGKTHRDLFGTSMYFFSATFLP